MMQNKKIVGITGGSGCGKSYISALLAENGLPVIDCDKVAHEVTEPGSACLAELCAFFGGEIIEDGRLCRRRLAKIVFSDPKKLEALNQITHKYILESIYKRIESEKSNTVLVDGAVLIESGIKCDLTVGILADRDIRKMRIIARDGLSEEEAERRLSAQKPDSFYEENCDFVVYNNENIDMNALFERIMNEKNY